MALSPAQRMRSIKLAGLAIAVASGVTTAIAAARPETGPEASAYALLYAQLGEHLRQLSDIKSVEGKIEAKRLMVPEYDDHILAVLTASAEANAGLQDEIFVTIMIWRIDIGDWSMALDQAEHVLKYGLNLPERYERMPATLIAEEFAEAALHFDAMDKAFPIPVLQRADAITATHDMNDKVRAKLQKALGVHFAREADRLADPATETTDGVPAGAVRAAREAALKHLTRAFELFPKIGVVKAIEKLNSLLKKEA